MSLQTVYQQKIVPVLKKELKRDNLLSLPKIKKVIVNVGMGTYLQSEKSFDDIINGIKSITGQAPVVRKAKKSVSNFKLREGKENGAYVTLRGKRMYDFLERVIHIVFPRIRDFRGFSPKAFDRKGNYSLGLKEHLIFPEIPTDKVIKPFGLQITIVTTTDDDKEARLLLDQFQFPFRK